MANKRKIFSAFLSHALKGLLCLTFMSFLAVGALITNAGTDTRILAKQFTVGATAASWSIYVNEVNGVKYLPGGFAEPAFDIDNANTYAFKVVTDAKQVCAVKIELTSAVNGSQFSNFKITVRSSTGGGWSDETVYVASTGITTKSYINGLSTGDAGYIHQNQSTTKYYEVKVSYSYDKVDFSAQLPVTFQYTLMPQSSFT